MEGTPGTGTTEVVQEKGTSPELYFQNIFGFPHLTSVVPGKQRKKSLIVEVLIVILLFEKAHGTKPDKKMRVSYNYNELNAHLDL